MTPPLDDAHSPEFSTIPKTRLRVVDCDVHHALPSLKALHPYLSARWRDHLDTFGPRGPVPFTGSSPYPKAAPALSRTDSWPANGGPPGSDLGFLQEQLLDRHEIDAAMLHLLAPQGMDQRNQEFGRAMCRALNTWTYEHWTQLDHRVKGAIMVPGEDPEAAVAEIEFWAGKPDFVQVSMTTHAIEPLGRRRYWPIYEAAARHNLPMGFHTSGFNGHAVTAAGWPSFYVEEHQAVAISQQQVATSLVCEGVFERFPTLKAVIVEAGFAWVPAVAWRLDRTWARMRDEMAHLPRPPSEYIREHLWFTTQPADEPERPEDLRAVIDWIGWDRLLFATDYPHWDMDNPKHALRIRLSDEEHRMIFADNASKVYGLG